MRPVARFLLLGLFLLTWLVPVSSQVRPNLSTAVAQLLDQATPAPPLREMDEALAVKARWLSDPSDDNTPEPGPDAPAKVFIDYWERQDRLNPGKQPSDASRWRMLEACLTDPRFWYGDLKFIPDTPQSRDRIKQFLDRYDRGEMDRSEGSYNKQAADTLRSWLRRHTAYFRDDLLRKAREVKDQNGYLEDEADFEAIASLDWRAAAQIVESYIATGPPAVAALASTLKYLHSVSAGEADDAAALRETLQNLVIDGSLSVQARERAMDALMQSDWPGRDEWLVSSFARISSGGRSPGRSPLEILAAPVSRDPDHWIPILSGLIGQGDRSVHNAAAFCLAQFTFARARRDALEPLLRWLSDPAWAEGEDEYTRIWFIESLARVKLPECLPGLISIVRNESGSPRSAAAVVLAAYADPQAVPVLREAIQKATDGYSDVPLVRALLACGGLSDRDIVQAFEALAVETRARDDRFRGIRFFHESNGVRVPMVPADGTSPLGRTGQALIEVGYASETVAAGVIDRWRDLRSSRPEVAAHLWNIALQWNLRSVELAMAERVADGTADLDTLLVALERRKDLQACAGSVLQALASQNGYAKGIGAVLRGDASSEAAVLQSKDSEACIGLLAAARMVRETLPIALVGPMLSTNDKLLQLAAHRYLESADTLEAQKLIRSRHPGDVVILGARAGFDPNPEYVERFNDWENHLLANIKSGDADKIFGVIRFYHSDAGPTTRSTLEVQMHNDNAEMCKGDDAARRYCRLLSPAELDGLRAFSEDASFAEWPPLLAPMFGVSSEEREFVRVDKHGGRRVYAANLSHLCYFDAWPLTNETPHQRMDSFLYALEKTGNFELRYALNEKIKDLEVLSADDSHPVRQVAGEGGALRVLVKDKEQDWDAVRKGAKDDSLNWHVLSGGKVGALTEQPKSCEVLDAQEDLPETMRDRHEGTQLWKIKTGLDVVRRVEWGERRGLWLCRVGREPRLIAKGFYFNPIVTPDGRWLVAVSRDNDNDSLVRIDLRTNRQTKIDTDSFFYPITAVPGSGKVLFTHYDKNDQSEHSLLDPATGVIETVKGEFAPVEHQSDRPLQPIAGSRDYWAAVPDYTAKVTRVGRYDAQAFKFTPMTEVPDIIFTSDVTWVDEASAKLYIAYKGHLLALPLLARSQH